MRASDLTYSAVGSWSQAPGSMGKKSKGGAGAAAAARPAAKPGAPVDPRFAALQTDPRFERFPAPRKAVTIDDRFAGASRLRSVAHVRLMLLRCISALCK